MTRFVYVLPAGRFRWEVRVDMGDLDLSRLSVVALAATPGPWRYRLFNGADQIMAPDEQEPGGEWPVVGMGKSYDPDEVPEDPHFMFDQDAKFIATFDPPTVLELLDIIDTEPQFYRRKAHALIAARAIAIVIGGEVQPHDRRGRIQDPDSYGNDSPRRRG